MLKDTYHSLQKRQESPLLYLVDSKRILEHLSAEDKVKSRLFSLEKRLHGDLITIFQYLRGAYREAREKDPSSRTVEMGQGEKASS